MPGPFEWDVKKMLSKLRAAFWKSNSKILVNVSVFLYSSVFLFVPYAAIAGVAAYNNHKLKKEASRAISDDSQQTQLTATTTSSTSER